MVFHCGVSSKDAGKRITTITQIEDRQAYKGIILDILKNPDFNF